MRLLSRLLPKAIKQWIRAELGVDEDKFARIFHTSADWIVITRLSDSQIVDANAGFEAMSGYRREEVLGHPMLDFNVWAEPEQRVTLVAELMRTGIARGYLTKMRTRDGSIRDCLVNCSLIALDGDARSHAVWIARDVTDQIVASEQFSAAFRLIPDCMTISRVEDGRYLEVNQAFERVMGLSRSDIVGKTSKELKLWQSVEHRNELVSLLRQNTIVIDHPVVIKAGNGDLREMLINCAVFASRGEQVMIAVLHDVTEFRAAEREIQNLNTNLEDRVAERTAELRATNLELRNALESLKLAKDQLVQSEKLAALGSIVAGVAHELNTPIGNSVIVASTQDEKLREITAQIDTGLKRSDLKKFVAEIGFSTEILMRNLARAAELVSSFKRVAVDRTSSRRREFSLAELTDQILLTLNPTLRHHHCKIDIVMNPAIVLDSFPGPLGQVLTNLINNAVLHGFSESTSGSIRIVADFFEHQHIFIELQDNGKGILAENLHRVFEPFFTTRLGQGGSGMGLHIVHNLVSGLLGGYITVASPGQFGGTTFRLILPLTAPLIETVDDGDCLVEELQVNRHPRHTQSHP